MFDAQNSNTEQMNFSSFIEDLKNGNIDSITVRNNKVFYNLVNGEKLVTVKEPTSSITDLLDKHLPPDVLQPQTKIEDTTNDNIFLNVLISVVPFLIVIGFFMYIMKQAQGNSSSAMSFGKSKAKMMDPTKKKTTFKDVAGANEAKEELEEVVDFLKHPKKYSALGGKIPKGIILIGSPGTGKTLLARAVAGEANVPFFSMAGSEFVEMFVGVGASRVRDLFKNAKKQAPCIIFIDEIDAVGRHRGAGMGGGHDEREQTLNQILAEMDGFENETGVIVIAATNRPDVLDPALLRPGRFDRQVVVDKPDLKAREEILKVHSRNKPLAKDADLNLIARQTPGFSGADLANLLNEAAIMTAKENGKKIKHMKIEKAIEKVMLGPEKKSRKLSDEELRITAFHETGHALTAHLLENSDPVLKLSIIARGRALGVTWQVPEKDCHMYSKEYFEDNIGVLLGGTTAEQIIFGRITTGASNDLERATKIARSMVTTYGMSSLGPAVFGESNNEVFLGKDFGHVKNYSEETARLIDEEIKNILNKAKKVTEKLLRDNIDLLNKISEDLLVKENIHQKEFLAYFNK